MGLQPFTIPIGLCQKSSLSGNAENPSSGNNESGGSPNTKPVTENVAASTASILLYLKDGRMYAASDYWFAGGKLHFILNDASENIVAMDELDVQRTVDDNAKRGVPFSLKQKPVKGVGRYRRARLLAAKAAITGQFPWRGGYQCNSTV